MDLKQLEYFVRVGELGSFSKAADALSVAQPFLSKRVRQLEIELHENLFYRNGRLGLSFTEEGALFFVHAKKVLDQISEARKELGDLKDSPTGKLTIGAVPDVRQTLAKHLVNTFLERYPKASLEIIEEKSGAIHQWLIEGRIDIGILHDPPASAHTKLVPLVAQELYLVSCAAKAPVPRLEPVEFRALGNFPLILPNHSHYLRRLVESEAAKTGISLNVMLEIIGASFILELVQQGHGHTILARRMLEGNAFSRKLQVNEIVNPRLTRTMVLAMPAQRNASRLLRETAALIATIMKSGG